MTSELKCEGLTLFGNFWQAHFRWNICPLYHHIAALCSRSSFDLHCLTFRVHYNASLPEFTKVSSCCRDSPPWERPPRDLLLWLLTINMSIHIRVDNLRGRRIYHRTFILIIAIYPYIEKHDIYPIDWMVIFPPMYELSTETTFSSIQQTTTPFIMPYLLYLTF